MSGYLRREDVVRRLTGLILGSSLADEQVISIAHALAFDRDLSSSLSRALLNSMQAMSFSSKTKDLFERVDEHAAVESMSIDNVVNWISAHNITKKQLITKLLNRKLVKASPATLQSQSVRDIVARVFASASPASTRKFFDTLGISVEPDAYLEGIEGRRAR